MALDYEVPLVMACQIDHHHERIVRFHTPSAAAEDHGHKSRAVDHWAGRKWQDGTAGGQVLLSTLERDQG